MDNIKVFELAKQLGIETIALMDKLREFKIPVKSHMAELDPDLIGQIQAKFEEEKKAKAPAKAAKVARPRKAAASKTVVPKVVKASQMVVKKAVEPTPSTTKTAGSKTTKDSALQNSRTVIRRKANSVEAQSEPEAASEADLSAKNNEIEVAGFGGEESSQGLEESAETSQSGSIEMGVENPAQRETKAPANKSSRTAQVTGRIDLNQTMGIKTSRPSPGAVSPSVSKPVGGTSVPSSQEGDRGGELKPFDREEMGKLIKQEALAQARKAAALARETKVETFNASDFRKRELLFQPKKKKTLSGRVAQRTQITTPSAQKRRIRIDNGISVSKLAQEMGIKAGEVLKKLMAMGSVVTLNDVLDFETAQILAADYSFEVENVAVSEDELLNKTIQDSAETQVSRPPVVTVMGHVDHGKTSLLDAIRSANVARGEAGGITQHIGAYSVEINGKKITFLDTPGHEAFTAMRGGAKVTDIVILVVAADDGIMPQTREAITHAKSAGVPIIVAVNKMDLPQANPQKVLQGLTEFELVPEEWGGTTIVAKVSAAKKEGIKELLEMVLLQAEVLELKANPNRAATGAVIEARLERGRGTVATLLIQQGTLRVGDVLIAGLSSGKVRAMMNDKGSQIKEAGPGTPVEVLGLNAVPNAGDTFDVAKDEETAAEIVDKRKEKSRVSQQTGPLKMSLEDLFAKVQVSDVKELPVIIKSDVHGSAEALKDMLNKIPAEQVKIKVLSSSVGGITESDVLLASASHAIIIGFNVRPETGVNAIAQREGVEIKTYSIIYEIVDDIKKAMTGMLSPTFVEKTLGRAEIRSLFSVPKIGTVAGCSVVDGKITRQASIRLLRDSRVIYEGKLASLRRFKDDAREVQTGYECGIGIENYNDLKVGDVIEAFVKEQVAGLLH